MKLGENQLKKITDLREALESTPWIGALIEDALINKLYNVVCAMEKHGTCDGKPYEEPAKVPTDEDAKQRPWVMVRDYECETWQIRKLLAVVEKHDGAGKYSCLSGSGISSWHQCRFPTDEERKENGI
jgi:hypothetical protein